jgi:Flp pilus assembly protein TadG
MQPPPGMAETARERREEALSAVVDNIRRTPRRRHDERGAALVEFAIASVVLLMLLFGIVTFGYVLSFKSDLTQAAAEGARAGAVGSDATAAITRSVSAFKQTCSPSGPLTCTTTTAACGSHSCITVALSYDWKNHPLIPKFPGLSILVPDRLTATSVAEVN